LAPTSRSIANRPGGPTSRSPAADGILFTTAPVPGLLSTAGRCRAPVARRTSLDMRPVVFVTSNRGQQAGYRSPKDVPRARPVHRFRLETRTPGLGPRQTSSPTAAAPPFLPNVIPKGAGEPRRGASAGIGTLIEDGAAAGTHSTGWATMLLPCSGRPPDRRTGGRSTCGTTGPASTASTFPAGPKTAEAGVHGSSCRRPSSFARMRGTQGVAGPAGAVPRCPRPTTGLERLHHPATRRQTLPDPARRHPAFPFAELGSVTRPPESNRPGQEQPRPARCLRRRPAARRPAAASSGQRLPPALGSGEPAPGAASGRRSGGSGGGGGGSRWTVVVGSRRRCRRSTAVARGPPRSHGCRLGTMARATCAAVLDLASAAGCPCPASRVWAPGPRPRPWCRLTVRRRLRSDSLLAELLYDASQAGLRSSRRPAGRGYTRPCPAPVLAGDRTASRPCSSSMDVTAIRWIVSDGPRVAPSMSVPHVRRSDDDDRG
jgi:hypothetical protein